jgi:hypothetical protein
MKEYTQSDTSLGQLNTALLFLVFNRPDVTRQVFAAIRQAKPPRLYVAADGPREGRAGEAEKVESVRRIATQVDWPCEVKTLFREKNLGCKQAVSGAISWFFEHEEQGIILEDDCLPHPDFFTFCAKLLDRYSDDERIWVITGNNFQYGKQRGNGSYYFSKYNHCWGWATWRRAWAHYRGDLPFLQKWQNSMEWGVQMSSRVERRYWSKIFESVQSGKIDSWAYPWTGSVWYHGGLTVTPNVNLVSNIGFGEGATHTTSTESCLAEMAVQPIGELRHPAYVTQDEEADRYAFDYAFGGRDMRLPWSLFSLPRRIVGKVYREIKLRIA